MKILNTIHIFTSHRLVHNILACTVSITLFLSGLCCASCNRNSQLTNELRKIHGKKLIINNDRMFHYTSEFSQHQVLNQGNVQVLVYIDSTVCSTCELNSLSTWKNEIFESDTIDKNIKIQFIFQSSHTKFSELCDRLKAYDIGHDMYIDSADVFRKDNPNLPTSKMLHTFLLDENNVVLLCGNPQKNMKINNIFKNEINKRIKKKINFRPENNSSRGKLFTGSIHANERSL